MRPVRRVRFGSRLTPIVTALIIANLATFLVFIFSGEAAQAFLTHWLVLTPGSLAHGHVWKLVTTAFLNDNLIALFLDLLVLWLFMPFLESAWGRSRFVRFAVITTLTGNLVSAGAGLLAGDLLTPIGGMAPFILGALVGYGVAFGDQPVQFFGLIPMKGRTLAIGCAVLVVLTVVLNGTWVLGAGYVAAMIAAFLMSSDGLTPRLWLLRWRRARLRRRYTVLDGGRLSRPEKPDKKQWLN